MKYTVTNKTTYSDAFSTKEFVPQKERGGENPQQQQETTDWTLGVSQRTESRKKLQVVEVDEPKTSNLEVSREPLKICQDEEPAMQEIDMNEDDNNLKQEHEDKPATAQPETKKASAHDESSCCSAFTNMTWRKPKIAAHTPGIAVAMDRN
eukprot:CAMPEP_0116830766 /NCGR_PEP_ID=MMETSP0418-20121206/4949_1 /TAXON_ID=1158023 /ORGANISM="Astrosyne radiata, Strain 13vi08-1A" /LENGTH=150 /DNA_ID=CAMNT_0004459913 /DNA_START=27 /DNA_END=479 /DNA_ORIENTATION=-